MNMVRKVVVLVLSIVLLGVVSWGFWWVLNNTINEELSFGMISVGAGGVLMGWGISSLWPYNENNKNTTED